MLRGCDRQTRGGLSRRRSPSLPVAFSGSEDLGSWKIAAIARGIAREQGKMSDGGVCADVEIRQGRCPRASATPVQQEALPGQENGFPGQGFARIQSSGQGGIQRFDGGVADRDLGVNNRIDDQCRSLGALCESPARPIAPVRIVRGDVKQDLPGG